MSNKGHRDVLRSAAALFALQAGYTSSDTLALETLTELLQSFITQVGQSSRSYAELCGRTKCVCSDVALALVDIGIDLASLPSTASSGNRVLKEPGKLPDPPTPRIMSLEWSSGRFPRPSHIPDFLPPFPEPHTYLVTPSTRPHTSEYAMVRQKAAEEKRRVETSLSRFLAKTGPVHSLFPGDNETFPLIASEPSDRPYLAALLACESTEHHESSEAKNKTDNPFLKRPRFPHLNIPGE